MTVVCAALGHFDAVPGWLDKVAQEHNVWSLAILLSPLHARLLAGPSYDALLRAMGLSWK